MWVSILFLQLAFSRTILHIFRRFSVGANLVPNPDAFNEAVYCGLAPAGRNRTTNGTPVTNLAVG